MTATGQIKYAAAAATAITCTLASLTNTSARQSTLVDNTTNQYLDALVMVGIKTGASGTSATGYVNVFAFGIIDTSSPTYPSDGTALGATDAAATVASVTNRRLLDVINATANATTYVSDPKSVAAAFGGVLPPKWGIIVQNQSGGTLDATEANHYKAYQGIENQSG